MDLFRLFKRGELWSVCKATPEAAGEPQTTRELALAAITAKGWNADDGRSGAPLPISDRDFPTASGMLALRTLEEPRLSPRPQSPYGAANHTRCSDREYGPEGATAASRSPPFRGRFRRSCRLVAPPISVGPGTFRAQVHRAVQL